MNRRDLYIEWFAAKRLMEESRQPRYVIVEEPFDLKNTMITRRQRGWHYDPRLSRILEVAEARMDLEKRLEKEWRPI